MSLFSSVIKNPFTESIRDNVINKGVGEIKGRLGLGGNKEEQTPAVRIKPAYTYDSGMSLDGPYVIPEDQIAEFPEPQTIDFEKIEKAPYKYVDPLKFAQEWGSFNRKEILKNYDIAKQIALQELDTELSGLSKYTAGAAALKRKETVADIAFNQAQRTAQIDTALPGVREQLDAQAKQATKLAKGEIPDFLTQAEDRALELGIRSSAADAAATGGFGAGSSVARKASDLMSAEARYNMGVQQYQLGLQQTGYGNQLLTQNIQQKAGLYVAPTEYSTVGQEIRTMPEVGAARLTAGALTEVNQLSMLPTQYAFSSEVQQQQYQTNLDQQTRQFNASGQFQASQFNAAAANQFALDKFNYQVGYAGVVAGTETANNLNAQGLAQQAQAAQIFQDYAQQAQESGQAGAISQGAGAFIPAAAQIINGLSGLWNGGNSPTKTPSGGGGGGGGVSGGGGGGGSYGGGGGTSIDPGHNAPDYSDGGDYNLPEFSYPATQEASDYYGSGYSQEDVPSDYQFDTDLSTVDYTGLDESSDSGYLFKQATGLQYTPYLGKSADATLRLAGVTKDPAAIPGSVNIGSDYTGTKVYSEATSLTAADPTAGRKMGQTIAQLLYPLGAFTEEDLKKLNNISSVASNAQVLQSLDNASLQGNSTGFVNTVLSNFDKGDISTLSGRAKNGLATNIADVNGAATAYTAHQAMQVWPQLSTSQKSILVGALGLRATDFRNGRPLSDVVIPNTQKPGTQPVTIGKATEWFSKGINAYPLTKKWDQFSIISSALSDRSDPDTVATTANRLKMLGAGTNGAEIPGVTLQGLQKAGWAPVTHLGVGAIAAKSGAILPKGYVKIADDGQRVVAAPPGTAYSAKGALLKSAANNSNVITRPGAARGPFNFTTPESSETMQGAQNILNWTTGAYNIYSMWHGGKPGVKPALGTAQVVGQTVDAYNASQGIPSNYGQMAGSAGQLYSAYEQARQGNYTGAATLGSRGSFNGMAAWAQNQSDEALASGNRAAAAQYAQEAAEYSQYASYAGAGLNFYGAYNSWEKGDKPGAIVQGAGGAAELTGYGGVGLVGGGAYTAYNAYGTGNIQQGALGGAMMMAGTVMLIGGPVGWIAGGALMAAAVLGSAIRTGTTNEEHIARNSFQGYLGDKTGLFNEDGVLVLADGTTWDVGTENTRHSVAHPELLAGNNVAGGEDDRTGENSLRAYDVDYTNDLDFTSAMMGQTLTRLIAGGANTAIDQTGSSFGNAGIANIGYGQDMTKENFDKMVANQRGFYARVGIGSKNDGYQLANAAYAEGRLNELQHTQAIQALDMIFDENGYETAQKLMGGRGKGVEAAQAQNQPQPQTQQPLPPPIQNVNQGQYVNRAKSNIRSMTRDQIKALNASRYRMAA